MHKGGGFGALTRRPGGLGVWRASEAHGGGGGVGANEAHRGGFWRGGGGFGTTEAHGGGLALTRRTGGGLALTERTGGGEFGANDAHGGWGVGSNEAQGGGGLALTRRTGGGGRARFAPRITKRAVSTKHSKPQVIPLMTGQPWAFTTAQKIKVLCPACRFKGTKGASTTRYVG